MHINLNDKISDNFTRIENLAKEAGADEEQSFSARASAMTATTSALKELIKVQEGVINMDRLIRIEQVTIETVKEFLNPTQIEVFLQRLEELINAG